MPFEAPDVPVEDTVGVVLAIEEERRRVIQLFRDAGGVIDGGVEIAAEFLNLGQGSVRAPEGVANTAVDRGADRCQS